MIVAHGLKGSKDCYKSNCVNDARTGFENGTLQAQMCKRSLNLILRPEVMGLPGVRNPNQTSEKLCTLQDEELRCGANGISICLHLILKVWRNLSTFFYGERLNVCGIKSLIGTPALFRLGREEEKERRAKKFLK